MKSELTFLDVHQKISAKFSEIKDFGIINLAVFTRNYSFTDDAELFAVFDKACDFNICYQTFSDWVDNLFPGYEISIYTERNADNLNQSIFDEMMFF
jgi:hypothetical protein